MHTPSDTRLEWPEEVLLFESNLNHHHKFISHITCFYKKILKINNLTKPIYILLHNDKNCFTWVTFLLTMVPPVHIAFLGEAYECCPQLPL